MRLSNIWFFKRGIENSIILYILLFLACFNLLGRGPVIFFIYSVYGIVLSKNVKWDNSLIPYIALAIGAFVPSIIFFGFNEAIKSFTYYLCFFAAYRGYYASGNKELYLLRTVWAATLGFFTHMLILYLTNFVLLEHVEGERIVYDLWTSELLPVTLVGLVSSVPIAFSLYCIFLSRNVVSAFFGIIFICVAYLINVGTATRTPFVIFAIVSVFLFLEIIRSIEGKKKIRIIMVSVILFLLLAYALIPYLETTAIGQRYETEGMETSRSELMVDYFKLMLDYPFGGGFGQEIIHKQAHNFLQEGYDLYGMFFFFALIIVFVQIVMRGFEIHRIKEKNNCCYIILLCYLVILLQSLVEPVIEGYPQLLWLLFVVDGFTIPYLRDNYMEVEEESSDV